MSDEKRQPPKKIIIDEDWKSQIAAEKETAAKQGTAKQGTGTEPAPATNAPRDPMELPPASFEMLLTSLATEAMMALGQIPIPGTGKPEINLPQAQYVIDMVEVLWEKTEGNRSPEETALMEELLHQLRMMYVTMDK